MHYDNTSARFLSYPMCVGFIFMVREIYIAMNAEKRIMNARRKEFQEDLELAVVSARNEVITKISLFQHRITLNQNGEFPILELADIGEASRDLQRIMSRLESEFPDSEYVKCVATAMMLPGLTLAQKAREAAGKTPKLTNWDEIDRFRAESPIIGYLQAADDEHLKKIKIDL